MLLSEVTVDLVLRALVNTGMSAAPVMAAPSSRRLYLFQLELKGLHDYGEKAVIVRVPQTKEGVQCY